MKRYPLADAIERLTLEREMRRVEREKRSPETSVTPKSSFVAVCKYGFAIHNLPAMAIWNMHKHVPENSKPAQVLLYEVPGGAADEGDDSLDPLISPTGWEDGGPVWPKGVRLPLVGLTWTGEFFKQRPKIGRS
jgi:hypothetical protein